MTSPLDMLLKPQPLKTHLYPPNSRYAGVDTTSMTLPDGRTVIYLRRRFVPQPELFQLIKEHRVIQGERLDNIAAAEVGDPILFWRICDANRAIRPNELVETIGLRLRITMPLGVIGT